MVRHIQPMVSFLLVALWILSSVVWGLLVALAAGFAGGVGAVIIAAADFVLWIFPTALLTDRLGITKLWAHSRQ